MCQGRWIKSVYPTCALKFSCSLAIHKIDFSYNSAYAFPWGTKAMNRKPFSILAVFVFVIVAVLHVVRLVFGWEVVINGAKIPMWVSPLGMVIAGVLAFGVLRECQQGKP